MEIRKKKVAIAGADGFVGRALMQSLVGEYQIIALSRRPVPPRVPENIEWRRCDLFSLIQCEQALTGVDCAFYLVHSMLPSAHLSQGHFENTDLILADNFARAAANAGLSHIVYLGGLIPEGEMHLSRHLRSRLEVEETLGARGVPVTALRAGMIIGSQGSSFHMLKSVVDKLLIIPCPRWSKSRTQTIALDDILILLRFALEHPHLQNRSFDVGSPEILSYRQLLERLAWLMGKRRYYFPVIGRRWYIPWLSLVSSMPMALIAPLLESMRHSMVASDLSLQRQAGVEAIPLDDSLRIALQGKAPPKKTRRPSFSPDNGYYVRSVQRIPLPPGKTARWLAEEYRRWLPDFFRFFLKARVDENDNLTIGLRFPSLSLLELTFDKKRSAFSERQLFYITGGALARKTDRPSQRPRLEFRQLLGGKCALVAVHDYRPTIPWPMYTLTQALAHLWVMRRFARHVRQNPQKQKLVDKL